MTYQLSKVIKENETYRKSFNELAVKVFKLSFEDWYEQGYWTDKYIPYALLNGDKVIANASVNLMEIKYTQPEGSENKVKPYIQIGTVMTDPDYRNQGLSRRLIEEILKDWKEKCQGIYLFANDSVLDFYPKFGFSKKHEFRHSLMAVSGQGQVRKLNMDLDTDRTMLKMYHDKTNPYALLSTVNNFQLLMFYCSSFMKDCVYYVEDFDAVVIMEEEGESLECLDIFCDGTVPMSHILNAVTRVHHKWVRLGFTPKDSKDAVIEKNPGDTLFLLEGREMDFDGQNMKFPSLSHA